MLEDVVRQKRFMVGSLDSWKVYMCLNSKYFDS